MNPREIHGGEPYFVVAEHCEALIDFHLPPDVNECAIDLLIRKAHARASAAHPMVSLDYEHLLWAPGFRHSEGDSRLDSLRRACERAGIMWQPGEFRSHSDATIFNATRTLTVVCGPGDLAVAHGRDEHIGLDEVEQAARFYAALMCEAGAPQP